TALLVATKQGSQHPCHSVEGRKPVIFQAETATSQQPSCKNCTAAVRTAAARLGMPTNSIGRQDFLKQGLFLPAGYRRHMSFARGVYRRLHDLHPVDIARTIRKNGFGLDADDQPGPLELAQERVVFADTRASIHAQPARTLEIDEQDSDGWIGKQV